MPNPSQQAQISAVTDSTESYTMILGLVKKFTFAQVKTWILSWIAPTVVSGVFETGKLKLNMSDESVIEIPLNVTTDNFIIRSILATDQNTFTFNTYVKTPYSQTVHIYREGLKLFYGQQFTIADGDNGDLIVTISNDIMPGSPTIYQYEIICYSPPKLTVLEQSTVDGINQAI